LARPIRRGIPDAPHFGVVTLSALGYGDIPPVNGGMRLLARLLLLLGCHGMMRGSRARLSTRA
jgi:hypothetical protein